MRLVEQFGGVVRTERHRLGMSQEELAGRAGLHRTYVADIERGARNPSLVSIEKLARALDVTLASLFFPMAEGAVPMSTVPVAPVKVPASLIDILLVEDDPGDAALAIRALRRAALLNRVNLVYSGEAALDYVFAQGLHAHRARLPRPTVIFLDLNLPGISGRDVLRRLKEDPRSRGIPVVVLTVSREADDQRFCQALGADAYLTKPLDFSRLCEVAPQLNFCWLLCDAGTGLPSSTRL